MNHSLQIRPSCLRTLSSLTSSVVGRFITSGRWWLLALLLLRLSNAGWGQCFQNTSAESGYFTLSVGLFPVAIAAGDFNGDGKPDLAVANFGTDNVSVLLNTGGGTFGPATNYSIVPYPYSLTVGDVNGDSKLDLVLLVDGSKNNIFTLIGNGRGAFFPNSYNTRIPPRARPVGDFNADGRRDSVVTNSALNNVSVLLGDDRGGYGTPTPFAVGDNPLSVAVADVNGDGKPDLAVANSYSNDVSILYNCAIPANTAPTVATAIPPQSATVGQAFSVVIPANAFADANSDVLTLSVNGLPAGLSFTAPATISGTPSVSGVSSVTVVATDPGSLSVSQTFTITVSNGPAAAFAITSVTPVNCLTLSAGLRQISFSPQYAGLTGQPISFSVVNELSPTTSPGPYSLNLYTDNPTIILKATQGGQAVSFAYNWLVACGPVAPPSGLAITGVTTVSCQTLSPGKRQLTFTPIYSGLTANPLFFSVVNELLSTTSPGPYTLQLYTDNPVITLRASQGSQQVSYSYNWLVTCGGSARRSALESNAGLQVRVLGNPVQNQALRVQVGGVVGQSVRLRLTDLRGQPVAEGFIEQAGIVEQTTLSMNSQGAGVLLLRVSTPTQIRTLNVVIP